MKFMIGDYEYPSKKAALEAVRIVLHKMPLDVPLQGRDFEFIRALLDLHHNATEKLKGGCKAIVVRMNKIDGMPPQRGFWIIHDNDSSVDFSIYVPFQTETQTRKRNIEWAARQAVREITSAYKIQYFGHQLLSAKCEISGEAVMWDDGVVHHAGDWPFDRILAEWLRIRGEPELIDVGISKELKKEDAADFMRFHNDRAVLQMIHKRENSRIGNRGPKLKC